MSDKMRKRLLDVIPPTVTIILFFLIWEVGCLVFGVDEFVLPSVAVETYFRWQSAIWPNALQTLYTTLVGFGLAIVMGVALGALIGYSELLYKALYPLLIGFNSIPKAALVPVFVIWFGVGTMPAILIAFLIAFFPIAVNVGTGIATVEPEMQDVLRSLGGSRFDMFRKIGFPRHALFLCLAQGGGDAFLRRLGHRRARRFQSRHRQHDGHRQLAFRGAAGLRRAVGGRCDGRSALRRLRLA